LLAGDVGHSLIGLSGLLLLTNLCLGLKLAWPASGQWWRTLRPRAARLNAAGLYSWHRALGLWIAPLALITVTCGTLLTFEDKVGAWIGAPAVKPASAENAASASPGSDGTESNATGPSATRVAPGAAIAMALGRYPGSTLAGAAFPWRTIHGEECSAYWPAGTARNVKAPLPSVTAVADSGSDVISNARAFAQLSRSSMAYSTRRPNLRKRGPFHISYQLSRLRSPITAVLSFDA
jgi:uncharacterized iron-regulated membrane protein